MVNSDCRLHREYGATSRVAVPQCTFLAARLPIESTGRSRSCCELEFENNMEYGDSQQQFQGAEKARNHRPRDVRLHRLLSQQHVDGNGLEII